MHLRAITFTSTSTWRRFWWFGYRQTALWLLGRDRTSRAPQALWFLVFALVKVCSAFLDTVGNSIDFLYEVHSWDWRLIDVLCFCTVSLRHGRVKMSVNGLRMKCLVVRSFGSHPVGNSGSHLHSTPSCLLLRVEEMSNVEKKPTPSRVVVKQTFPLGNHFIGGSEYASSTQPRMYLVLTLGNHVSKCNLFHRVLWTFVRPYHYAGSGCAARLVRCLLQQNE